MENMFVLPDPTPRVFWLDPKQTHPRNRPLFLDNGRGERIPIDWQYDEPRKGLVIPCLRLPRGHFAGWNVDYGAFLAPVFDKISSNTGASPLSLAHTPTAGGPNLIAVWSIYNVSDTGIQGVTAITWDGVTASQLYVTTVGSTGQIYQGIKLLGGDPNSHTLQVTFSGGSGTRHLYITIATYIQATAPTVYNSATGSSTTPSVTLTSPADNTVVDAAATYTQSLVVGGGQNQRWNIFYGATSDKTGAGGATTMSWTDSNGPWVVGAVSIPPAAGGGQGAAVSPMYMI